MCRKINERCLLAHIDKLEAELTFRTDQATTLADRVAKLEALLRKKDDEHRP